MTLQIDKPNPNAFTNAKVCVICKKMYFGKDFDAEPVCEGRCCEECFSFYVCHAKTLQYIIKKLRGDE